MTSRLHFRHLGVRSEQEVTEKTESEFSGEAARTEPRNPEAATRLTTDHAD